jgi:hypothetical protein
MFTEVKKVGALRELKFHVAFSKNIFQDLFYLKIINFLLILHTKNQSHKKTRQNLTWRFPPKAFIKITNIFMYKTSHWIKLLDATQKYWHNIITLSTVMLPTFYFNAAFFIFLIENIFLNMIESFKDEKSYWVLG